MPSYTPSAPATLFDIAAAQLGDPLLWWQVAQASGLSDPMAIVGTVLVIPIVVPSNDGLPPTGSILPPATVPAFAAANELRDENDNVILDENGMPVYA